MHRWKLVGGLAAVVAAGVLGSALPGNAQKKPKADPVVGYVDLGRITDKIKETPEWQQMVKSFEDEKSKYQDEIQYLTKIRYLTTAERQELENLRAKKTATDAEKAKIADLEGRSDAMDKEFQSLAGVEKPTDQQKQRLQELGKLRENAIASLQDETEKRAQLLQKREGEALDQTQDRIVKLVSDVANGKDLAMVIDRQALLYGGLDLTNDVLKKLGARP